MTTLLRWTIKDLVETIEEMIKNKFDCIIFIDGKRGLSKSTLGWILSRRINKIDFPFKPKRDLIYKRDVAIKHVSTKKKGIIFVDEMINVAYNRDFYVEDQKILLKALNMYRDSCNVIIGCIPAFADLDKQLRKLCKIRLTCVRRGVAIIQTQVQSIYMNDPWDLKNNLKIESTWALKGTKRPRYAELTTVRGMIMFKDINEKQRKLYESLKHEKRNRIYQEYEDPLLLKDPDRLFYTNLMERLKTKELTLKILKEICFVSGKKYSAVRSHLNELLRDTGVKERVGDYLLSINKTLGKDRLNFVLNE